MAKWQRKPAPGIIVHSDRGAGYTSCIFGHRLREAGLLGSIGNVASTVDNTLIKSFCSSTHTELLDRQPWNRRVKPTSAMFGLVEGSHNLERRHSPPGWSAPAGFEQLDTSIMVATP